MKKTLKIILCVAACAVMSVPFAVLIDLNRRAVSAQVLHLDSTFRLMSVIFFVQIILAIIGIVLLFILGSVNSRDDDMGGCMPLCLAGLTGFAFYQLNDFGEGWISGGNDPFSLLMHPEWGPAGFYIRLTICWLAVMISTACLVFGKFSGD